MKTSLRKRLFAIDRDKHGSYALIDFTKTNEIGSPTVIAEDISLKIIIEILKEKIKEKKNGKSN